jgi:hypothetical protein
MTPTSSSRSGRPSPDLGEEPFFSAGVAVRQSVEVRSQKKLPSNSLLPERVAATTAALLIWSNSAL